MHTSRNLRHSRPFDDLGNGQTKSAILLLVLSFVLHAAAFGAMLFFQDLSFPKPLPPVIKVDLVSFDTDVTPESAPQSSTEAKSGIPLKPSPPKPQPKKIKHITADISLKTKPKNIKELMAQQQKKKKEKIVKKQEKNPEKPQPKEAPPKPEEKIKPELEPVEEKPQDESREQIAKALNRLKKKVKSGGPDPKEGSSQYAGGRRSLNATDLYNLVIQSEITKNWVFSDILAGMDQDLEVTIIIKILKSGQIRDIFFETRSGNRYLDESAKKAIMKSNPLPALPSGMPHYTLGLIFTPKGLK